MKNEKIKEGLSAIAREILEDVQKAAETLILEAVKDAEETLKMAKYKAEANYAAIMDNNDEKIDAERRRIQLLTDVEIRNILLQIKEEAVEAAFEKAKKNLEDFVKTKNYHNYLKKFIWEAAEKIGSQNLQVQVNSSDKLWLKEGDLDLLSKKMNVEFELEDETIDCLGGCIVSSADGKMVFNNTLENRIDMTKAMLRHQTAADLFSTEKTAYAD